MTGLKNLRTLLVFLSEQSVTRASERLGISQPAASNALARLRVQFGDPLLLPTRGGMVITERAKEIEQEARVLIQRYDALTRPAQAFDPASSKRRFVVTCSQFAEHILIPELFKLLRKVAPEICLEVLPPVPSQIHDWLESGRVDIRIAWPYEQAGSLRFLPLAQDRIVCIADPENPLIGEHMDSDTFLMLPQVQHAVWGKKATIGRVVEDAFKSRGVIPPEMLLVQNFLTIPDVISGTDLVAMVPERIGLRFAKDYGLRLLVPPMKLPRIKYAAYWHERSHNDQGHRWLRGVVREAARRVSSMQS